MVRMVGWSNRAILEHSCTLRIESLNVLAFETNVFSTSGANSGVALLLLDQFLDKITTSR